MHVAGYTVARRTITFSPPLFYTDDQIILANSDRGSDRGSNEGVLVGKPALLTRACENTVPHGRGKSRHTSFVFFLVVCHHPAYKACELQIRGTTLRQDEVLPRDSVGDRRGDVTHFPSQAVHRLRIHCRAEEAWLQRPPELKHAVENGSTRRVDILAYKAATKQGIIVDPTIRFEVECHQSAEVHLEKKSIYEPTVNYFKLKYALNHVELKTLERELRGTDLWFLSSGLCLAKSESSLRSHIVGGPNRNKSFDYGIFQINNKYWCGEGKKGGDCNLNCADLKNDNIGDDIECARKIQRRHGFKGWYGWQKKCQGALPALPRC
ncbi:hypothetical protein ANN_25357 [Periplaneta americana]|uniref:lysozyme n=1 Tax=Periplaneta americana TaxID=6978 RepID=A0ABQ8S1C2_PERAM|nr:hypothetical protein ANN_25357 [Periplaneta americana]